MKRLVTILITGLVFLAANAEAVNAQTFTFQLTDPSKTTISQGSNFGVNVMINTAGQQTISGDALITFDSTKVNIDSAKAGGFYNTDNFSGTILGGSTSKFLVSAWEESIAHQKSSNSDVLFATLNMTAKSQGSATLSFDCTAGNTADSNITKASDQTDILNCSSLKTFSLTIGPPGPTSTPSATPTRGPTATPNPTSTPRPTSTPIPTNTPRPTISQLPRSGSAEVTVVALGIGSLLTVLGILIIL